MLVIESKCNTCNKILVHDLTGTMTQMAPRLVYMRSRFVVAPEHCCTVSTVVFCSDHRLRRVDEDQTLLRPPKKEVANCSPVLQKS